MAQSFVHAQTSARHFGGKPEDYIAIHEFIDQYKDAFGDVRHRAFLHHTKGPWIVQDVFGHFIEVFDEKTQKTKKVVVREIAENHIVEDLGCLPSPGDWADCMNCHVWMGGKRNKYLGREEVLNNIVIPAKEDTATKPKKKPKKKNKTKKKEVTTDGS